MEVVSFLESKLGMTSDHSSISMNLFVALLCAWIIFGHFLEESRCMNESITALLIGLCAGIIMMLDSRGKSSHLLVFSEYLFFIYLLPPIIFNAGCQVKKKQFFRNFMTIILYGALGTLLSFVIISSGIMFIFSKMNLGQLDISDYLAIGAIFSVTDSVCTLQVSTTTWLAYSYSSGSEPGRDTIVIDVFGEGVVNDDASVVLCNAIQNFDLLHINSGIALQLVGNFLVYFTHLTGGLGGIA